MAKSSDWLPGSRMAILAMCRSWLAYMTVALRNAWGVPEEEFRVRGTLFSAAEALLQKAQDEAERTHVITVECQAAFKFLTAKMRLFRDRYFKMPPLTEGDWAALGFKAKDPHQTPVLAPDGVPAVSRSCPGGPCGMTAHLGPMTGTRELNPGSDYGYAVSVGVMPPGGAALEQAASEKHYLMKPPTDGKGRALRALPVYPAAEGEDPLRRGGRRHGRIRLLPLRKRQRRKGAVGSGCLGGYSMTDMRMRA